MVQVSGSPRLISEKKVVNVVSFCVSMLLDDFFVKIFLQLFEPFLKLLKKSTIDIASPSLFLNLFLLNKSAPQSLR